MIVGLISMAINCTILGFYIRDAIKMPKGIVHCANCRYYGKVEGREEMYCNYHRNVSVARFEDDYCSRGEVTE